MRTIEITYRIEANGKSATRTIKATSEDEDIDAPDLPERLWKALREKPTEEPRLPDTIE